MNKCVAISSFDIIESWPIPGQPPNLIKIKTGDILEFEKLKVKFNKKKRIWKVVRPNQIGTIINRIYLSNNQIDEINVKKASNEESPVVNNSGPRNDLNDDDLMDLLSPNADFTYKFSPLRFGFDLNSIEGELKSSDFNEDFINWTNLSVEEPPPASSSILGEEIGSYRDWLAIQIKGGPQPDFVEHDLMAQMLKNIRQGLSWIKSGQLQSGLGYLPKSGFERYGVDDFRAFIKKAYEENRLLINTDKNIPSDIDNDPERLRWTIEVRPTPGKTVIDINKLRDMDLYDNMEVDKNRFGVNYNRDAIKVPSVSKTIDIDALSCWLLVKVE
jgi:hypothetical protein